MSDMNFDHLRGNGNEIRIELHRSLINNITQTVAINILKTCILRT